MALQLRQVGCSKGHQRLFAGVDLTLWQGELLHVTGDNGSGKTTLLRILAGLQRDHAGDVLWDGRPIHSCWHDYSASLLYLGHQPALKASLTATENLAWYASAQGVPAAQIGPALAALGMASRADLPCHALSAGQQRRVALARLLFSRQPLWLLDEPFTALDRHGLQAVVEHLRDHLDAGGMAVMTSHHGMESLGLPHRSLPLGSGNPTGAAA